MILNRTDALYYSQLVNSITPIVAILATSFTSIFIAWYYNKKNSENLIRQLNQQSKNTLLDIHRNEIVTSIKKFFNIVKQGKKREICRFLNEEDSLYIAHEVKDKVICVVNETSNTTLNDEEKEKIFKLLRECLGLFNDPIK